MPRTNVLKEGVRFLAAAKILNLSKKAIFDVLISYGFPKENITPTSKMNQEMAEILNAKFKVQVRECGDLSELETGFQSLLNDNTSK